MARTVFSTLIGVITIFLGVATAILLFILALSPISIHQQIYALPFVAAIVQVFACCVRMTLFILKFRHDKELLPQSVVEQTTRRHSVLLTLRILLSLAAAAVVGSALGWGEANLTNKNLVLAGMATSTLLAITWVVWGISILVDVLYYISIIWVHKNSLRVSEQRFSIDDTSREMIEPSRPATSTTIQSNPFHERLPSSPPSLIASDGTTSLRSSLSTSQRPSSLKRGILIRQNSYTRHSSRSSWDSPSGRPSHDEGFDSWDTSGVSSQLRETVLQSKSMKGSGLEPIPGSRSPSPAKALEGPFFQSSPSLTPPPSPQPSVSRPNSPPSSPLGFPSFAAMFPPPSTPPDSSPILQHSFPRPGTRSGPVSRSGTMSHSRPGSRSRPPSSEDHIHPLFRTSSPTPPPSASAGTNVTAAPEAGQLINERMLKRMRSGSLPGSPSPLVRSESSPDIRTVKMPPSPTQDTTPTSPTVSSRLDHGHQRKRSASFSVDC